MATKHTGGAENMKPGGADESSVKRQNAPFRDLHKSGHDVNHSYKNPAAMVTNITSNLSYMHPHDIGAGAKEVAKGAFGKANIIKPITQVGPGKS
ncbi:MAG: hypothetical protein PVS2B2_26100 [Candidatus Acidiferrum sp.]